MYKSLFSRYLTAFLLIIVVAFSIIIGVVGVMMTDYSNEVNSSMLSRTAASIGRTVEAKYAASTTENYNRFVYYKRSELQTAVDAMSDADSGVIIFVTDAKGNVLLSGNEQVVSLSEQIAPELLPSLYDDGSAGDSGGAAGDEAGNAGSSADSSTGGSAATAANVALRLDSSDLGGVLATQYSISAVAISGRDGETVGAAYAIAAADTMKIFISTMVKTLITECLWVLLAALIAVYFISERITSPLKKMSMAAKSFAAGQFDVRVPVIGHSEVADLATAFNNMASSLAKTEETRRVFLANVSHDLRTPMTTIGGFIDGILDGAIPPEKYEHYLGIIASEVRRLSRLVNSLLEITRIQAGERKFNMESFDIAEMAREILISNEQRIEKKHLDVSFECDNDRMFVYADRDAIYQILYNLCDNAVKFSRDGGAYKISIIAKAGKVYTSVYNEGQGIADDDIDYVFDRFYKSDKSRGLDKTGTGLGLYIAKTIIDAHHEEIWVRSVYGKFCEFVFTLPQTHDPRGDELVPTAPLK